MKNRLAVGYVLPSQTNKIKTLNEIISDMKHNKKLILTTLDYKPEGFDVDYRMHVEARSISSYNNSFEYLTKDLIKYKKSGYTTVLVCSSRTRAQRIVDDLGKLDIPAFYSEDFSKDYEKGLIIVTYGREDEGLKQLGSKTKYSMDYAPNSHQLYCDMLLSGKQVIMLVAVITLLIIRLLLKIFLE